jgi:hypothetical protein
MRSDKFYYNDGGGIYCLYPWDNDLEDGQRGIFKIGNTCSTFQKRLNEYHTYFIHGVFAIAFLYVRSKDGKEIDGHKKILNDLEKELVKLLKQKGGVMMVDPDRVWKGGQSEFIYSNLNDIYKSFVELHYFAKKKYPNLKYTFDMKKNVNKTSEEITEENEIKRKWKKVFVGELVFNLDPKFNVRSKKAPTKGK